MNYEQIKLGELCEITSSKRIFASEYTDCGIPFYRSKEIIEKSNNEEISDPLFISEDRYKTIISKFGCPLENDILLTSVGTLGIPYIVKKDERFYFKDGNLTWMRKFDNSIEPKFIYYWLRSDFGKKPLIARAIGSSQGAITIDILKKYPILLPDIKIQKKIVEIISAYDKLITFNNNKLKILEKEIDEIYNEWFVRKNNIKNNVRLANILSFDRGLSYSSEQINVVEGCNLINLGNIKAFGGFIKENIKLYDGTYKQNQIVTNGDLIMGVTDMTQDRRTVGSVALLENLEGINVISADLIKINSKYSNYYLYSLFKFGKISKYISQFANGTNVLHLRPESILKIKVDLPEEILMNKYSNFVKPIFEYISILKKQNENLMQQRDMLLPRLMSGNLEVK